MNNKPNDKNTRVKRNFFATKAFVVILSSFLVIALGTGGFFAVKNDMLPFLGKGDKEKNTDINTNDVADVLDNNKEPAQENTDNIGTESNTDKTSKMNVLSVKPSSIGDAEIFPLKNTEEGVPVDTDFIVKTKENIPLETLVNRIKAENVDFKVEAMDGDNQYKIKLQKALMYDTVYKFTYTSEEKSDLSFAFQTVAGFRVLTATPADKSYWVPLASGIEFTFTEPLGTNAKIEDYFIITPKVSGKFTSAGNTYVFVPDDKFESNTKYSVRLQKGLKGKSGISMEEDCFFQFNTEWGNNGEYLNIFGNIYETFLPEDKVFAELACSKNIMEQNFDVSIYSFENKEDFLNRSGDKIETLVDSSKAKPMQSFSTELFIIDSDYSVKSYLLTDKTLPEGYYAITIGTQYNGASYSVVKYIQVSPVSVYSAYREGEMIFWINDTIKKAPVQGAKIIMEGTEIGSTDSEGKLLAQVAGKDTEGFFTVKCEGRKDFVYISYISEIRGLSPYNRYYSYLYTDRKVYKPTDTIDVYGVVKQRYGEYPITPDDKFEIKVAEIFSVPVKPDRYGVFAVKIPVSDMTGYANISLYKNGEDINDDGINFVDYSKSKYVVSTKNDKLLYEPDETVYTEINVTTYDNAPAPDVQITDESFGASYKTDSNGNVTAQNKVDGYSDSSWEPYYTSKYFTIGGTEDLYQYISVPYYVMPSQIMLETKKLTDNSVEITTSKINKGAIEKGLAAGGAYYSYIDSDIYRGVLTDIEFTAEVWHNYTTKEQTGSTYDFINKINIPQYRYDYHSEVVDTYNLKTQGGKAAIQNLPRGKKGESESYYLIIKFKDAKGTSFVSYYYYDYSYDYYNYNQSTIKRFNFILMHNNAEKNTESQYDYPHMVKGEKGNIVLVENKYSKKYEDIKNGDYVKNGKILYFTYTNKTGDFAIGSPSGIPFELTENFIPEVFIAGAYFDGKYIYPIEENLRIRYDYEEKNLEYDLKFDKETYKPGDEVTLEINVKDTEGTPKKAELNISVVDEAVFAENNNRAYILSGLYESLQQYGVYFDTFSSYTQHEMGQPYGAESGEGGDETAVRKNFVDNPAFETVETDDKGYAKLKFKLADSITSWRVTVHGITEDLFAGDTIKNIIATMPFNIEVITNDRFLSGSDVFVIAKPLGAEYKVNKTVVEYAVKIKQGNDIVFETTQSGNSQVVFNAGKLNAGIYTVTVTAKAGNFNDAVEKTIEVTESDTSLEIRTVEEISSDKPKLKKFDVKSSPVEVRLYNYDYGFILDLLDQCVYSANSSNRTDMIAANVFAEKFYNSVYSKKDFELFHSDLYRLYNYTYGKNGIPEMIYGGGDILYTARLYACFPELVDDATIKNWISDIYTSPTIRNRSSMTAYTGDSSVEAERAAKYLLLASTGYNVLLELYDQVKIITDDPEQDKFGTDYKSLLRVLYYSAALCSAGDDLNAYKLYEMYRSKTDSFKDEAYREYFKTLELYINTKINPELAYEYLKTKPTNKYVSDVSEKINFIRNFKNGGKLVSEVAYTLDGSKKTERLEEFETVSLTLTKEQFKSLDLTYISGKTAANITLRGGAENLVAENKIIRATKEIVSQDEFEKSYGKLPNAPSSTDPSIYYTVIKFSLPQQMAGNHTFQINDRIPDNMRYFNDGFGRNVYNENSETESVGYSIFTIKNNEVVRSNNYYMYSENTEKQNVEIHADYFKNDKAEYCIVYRVRKLADAAAAMPEAYVRVSSMIQGYWGSTK